MDHFFPAGAPNSANLNLVVQLLMGCALLAGWGLARRKRFRAHRNCQASVVLFNLVPIATVMLPTFHQVVQPQLPAALGLTYYRVVSIHAVLGAAAELLGLYVVLAAGTTLLPRRLRFRRFKVWMRTTLALWWLVVLLGVATYYVWYVRSANL